MVVDLVRRFIIMEDCVPKGEAVWDVIPNIDPVPPIGCFCARLMDNSAREDWKLDPKNQSGETCFSVLLTGETSMALKF